MDDENCKECYDCKSVFTTWRRKHHCRICGKPSPLGILSEILICLGQIFCSRCASNIIKGARFGSQGMVRVCNLCLEKLAKVEEDDDDDRRSIVSSVTSFPAHQLGIDAFINMGHPQSPFAASQLFGRTDEPFNLYSIAETKRPDFGSEDNVSRPETPYFSEYENAIWEPIQDNPAPFRRPLPDEEKDHGPPPSFNLDISPTKSDAKGRIEFPTTKPIATDVAMSSIQFPIGSPERSDSSRTMSKARGPNTYGEYEVATPFIRSRVQSRLDPSFDAEPGWRTRRESTASVLHLFFPSSSTHRRSRQICSGTQLSFHASSKGHVASNVDNRRRPQHRRVGGHFDAISLAYCTRNDVYRATSSTRTRHGCQTLC